MKKLFVLSLLVLPTLFLLSCNSKTVKVDDEITVFIQRGDKKVVLLQPNTPIEECFPLKKGQFVEYAFQSENSVDFNFHYHVEHKVYYPAKEDDVESFKGKYTADTDRVYCLMWTSYWEDPKNITYVFNLGN